MARTPYNYFANECYKEIKKEDPSVKFKDISPLIAKKWKNMDEIQRGPYYKMEQDDKNRHVNDTIKFEDIEEAQ